MLLLGCFVGVFGVLGVDLPGVEEGVPKKDGDLGM